MVQLLHYKSLDTHRVLSDVCVPASSMPVIGTAEVVVFCGDSEGDSGDREKGDDSEGDSGHRDIDRVVLHCEKPTFGPK